MFSRSRSVIKCWKPSESHTALTNNTTWLLLNCFIDFWGLCGWLYWRLCLFFTVFLLVRLLLNAGAGWWIHTLVLTTQRAWRCTLHATLAEAALSCRDYSGWIFHLSPVPTAMPAFWHRHPRRRYGSRRYKWEVGQGSCLITADRGGKDVCCFTPQYEKESLWSKKKKKGALSDACPLTEASIKDKGRKAVGMGGGAVTMKKMK